MPPERPLPPRRQRPEEPTRPLQPLRLSEGQVLLERYALIAPLGRGGMGEVWLAQDSDLEVRRALKFLPAAMCQDDRALRGLRKEARLAARLAHPHIVTLRTMESVAGRHAFLVYDYVPGWEQDGRPLPDLDRWLFFAETLTEDQVRRLLGPILEGLAYAHDFRDELVQGGIVHRDLKPANILLDSDGTPRITDFGIARTIQSSMSRLTGAGLTSGTLLYMSPEQIRGRPCDGRSDIYSLGMVIYELLTGEPPFVDGDITYQHLHEPVPPIEGVSDAMNTLIARATAKTPEERWQTCAEMRDALLQGPGVAGAVGAPIAVASPIVVAQPMVRTPLPARETGPERDDPEALAALEELLAALKNRDLPTEERIVYLKDFICDYPDTSAASEARRNIAAIEALARLTEEAREAHVQLLSEESRDILTPSQAALRARKWSAYIERYSETGHEVETAQAKAHYYNRWGQEPAPGTRQSISLSKGVTLGLIWVPSGTFNMGSPNSEEGRDIHEGPVHAVTLDGFWMGVTPVTQSQYVTVVGTNPSNHNGVNLPVEHVSWNNSIEFCRRLTERTGKPFKLPTEAQWEYASRAGSATRFHFGDDNSVLDAYGWHDGNSGGWLTRKPHPVAQKRPNAWGLYDMHGNVWEWCLDQFDDDFYARPEAAVCNPINNPAEANCRVLRGGSWNIHPNRCRSASRRGSAPTSMYDTVGFRVVAAPGG